MNKLFITACLLLFFQALAFGQSCVVISAHDGDTLRVRDASGRVERVRLYGIDCPEIGQRYGTEARNLTRRLIGQVVDVQSTGSRSWGRVVSVIVLPDGGTLQSTLVENGLAWVDDRYCKKPECSEWRGAQKLARRERIGLWADDAPIPPWTWRRIKK